MAEVTKDIYLQYAQKIVSVLNNDDFYSKFKKRVDSGVSSFKLAKKRLIQDISIDWIETIEDCLPNLDNIVRNPRKFIVQEEDIVDISLARSISTESVKHLAQHTNMISKVDADGTVTPNRILNITKEESFEIYENRFIYTLLLKLKDFVTSRYDKIKKASATQDVLELDIESRFNLPSKKITYRTEYFAQLSFDEVMQLDPDTLTKIERIAKIDRIITDFLSSGFAKQMRNSAPVRPPISRTNVILKEPNFKKALTLWQFVETYQQTGGFSASDEVENYPLDSDANDNLNRMVTLNTMLFESMYEEHEKDMEMEDAEFADFINVGKMDFLADQLNKEEYGQKLDKEFEKEQEEKEELESTQSETPDEADLKSTEDQNQQEDNQEPETPGEQEANETPVELPPEKEPEPTPDEEIEVEKPPKEFDDSEPDAQDFDNFLFDVRKIYKLPKEDKIRQSEVIKAKDAIDRCLVSYRKIKQEILDMRELEFRRRIKREEAERRAEEFRKQRDIIQMEYKQGDSFYFGIDPFKQQEKKMILHIEDEKIKDKTLIAKKERLSLEDKDLDGIKNSIEKMEKAAKDNSVAARSKNDTKLKNGTKAVDKKAKTEKNDEVASDITSKKNGGIRKSNIDLNNPFGSLGSDVFGAINSFGLDKPTKGAKANETEKKIEKANDKLDKLNVKAEKSNRDDDAKKSKKSETLNNVEKKKKQQSNRINYDEKQSSISKQKTDEITIDIKSKKVDKVKSEKTTTAKKTNNSKPQKEKVKTETEKQKKVKVEMLEQKSGVATKYNLNLSKTVDDPFSISNGGVDVFAQNKKRRTSADMLFDQKDNKKSDDD